MEYDTSGQFLQEIIYQMDNSSGLDRTQKVIRTECGDVFITGNTSQSEENYLTLLKYAAPPKKTPEEHDLLDIILYPNPNTGICYLKGDGITSINTIALHNSLGQTMPNSTWGLSGGLIEIDASYFPSGCYWLRLGNKKGDKLF